MAVNGIRFTVTTPPQNWCVRSTERDEVIKNLRIALGESWSMQCILYSYFVILNFVFLLLEETFGRARVDFNAMRNRTSEFTSSERLPRSRKKMEAGPGGIMTLVDAVEETICVPSDPRTMDPPVLEAWYNMFVDDTIPEPRRFRWIDAKATMGPRVKRIPGSIQVEAPRTSAGPSSKGKGKHSTSARSNGRPGDEVMDSGNDSPSDYVEESETSAGEGPSNPRERQPTVSRSGRISAAPRILTPISNSRPRPIPQDPITTMPASNANINAKEMDGQLSGPANSSHGRTTSRPALTTPCKTTPPSVATLNSNTFFKLYPPKDRYPLYLPVSLNPSCGFGSAHNV